MVVLAESKEQAIQMLQELHAAWKILETENNKKEKYENYGLRRKRKLINYGYRESYQKIIKQTSL